MTSWIASHATARCSSPYPTNPTRVRISSGRLVATRVASRRALLATVMPAVCPAGPAVQTRRVWTGTESGKWSRDHHPGTAPARARSATGTPAGAAAHPRDHGRCAGVRDTARTRAGAVGTAGVGGPGAGRGPQPGGLRRPDTGTHHGVPQPGRQHRGPDLAGRHRHRAVAGPAPVPAGRLSAGARDRRAAPG